MRRATTVFSNKTGTGASAQASARRWAGQPVVAKINITYGGSPITIKLQGMSYAIEGGAWQDLASATYNSGGQKTLKAPACKRFRFYRLNITDNTDGTVSAQIGMGEFA